MNVSIGEALQITGICMGIVFVTLIAILMIIQMFPYVFKNRTKPHEIAAKESSAIDMKPLVDLKDRIKKPHELTTDEERVVAMVTAMEASANANHVKVRVHSLKVVCG